MICSRLAVVTSPIAAIGTWAADPAVDHGHGRHQAQENHGLTPMTQALEASTSVHFVRLTDPQGAPLLCRAALRHLR